MIIDPEWKDTIQRGTGKYFWDPNLSVEENSSYLHKREKYRKSISWHIPSDDIIERIIKYGPVISVGSGYGYTESIAIEKGGDVICSDISPGSNGWCKEGDARCEIIEISGDQAVKKYKERNVFMAWPPYNDPMAYNVIKEMLPGKILIYIGEGEGGCTGDDLFFDYLYKEFDEVEFIRILSWTGIHDNCRIYIKK